MHELQQPNSIIKNLDISFVLAAIKEDFKPQTAYPPMKLLSYLTSLLMEELNTLNEHDMRLFHMVLSSTCIC